MGSEVLLLVQKHRALLTQPPASIAIDLRGSVFAVITGGGLDRKFSLCSTCRLYIRKSDQTDHKIEERGRKTFALHSNEENERFGSRW